MCLDAEYGFLLQNFGFEEFFIFGVKPHTGISLNIKMFEPV